MNWIVVAGILLVAFGTGLTYFGQSIDSKKLERENAKLQNDVTKIKEINEGLEKRIVALTGGLTPDNKITPAELDSLAIPEDAIIFLLGNSVAYNNSFPHTVIEVGSKPLLVISKQNNKIIISAKFSSDDGKIVAELKDNHFYINPNNYFRIERPNDHVLIVYNQKGDETLNVEFMNSKIIKLTGRFYLPGRPPIIIHEDYLSFGGIQMSKNVFGQNRVDISLQ